MVYDALGSWEDRSPAAISLNVAMLTNVRGSKEDILRIQNLQSRR